MKLHPPNTPCERSHPALRRRSASGFTLIELGLVLLLIGILGAAGVSSFRQYVYRARRSESMVSLKTISDLQVSYWGNNYEYADSFAKLGFDIPSGGGLMSDGSIQGDLYTYVIQTWELDGKANANFRVTATGNIDPTDAVLDIVIIENQLTVKD